MISRAARALFGEASSRDHHEQQTEADAPARAGGWTDGVTMERCYDLPDQADLLAVTSETNKRHESLPKAIGGTN